MPLNDQTSLSLLWPPGAEPGLTPATEQWGENTLADLGLGNLAGALSPEARRISHTQQFLLALCADPTVIRYRQEVLEDLLRCPALAASLTELLPQLAELSHLNEIKAAAETPLHQTIWRIGELELYTLCVRRLGQALAQAGPEARSAAFQALRETLTQREADPIFQALVQQLPELRAGIDNMGSLTLGVNLDHELRPVEATLLSINPQPFRGRQESLLTRLLGGEKRDELEGLGPLHSLPHKTQQIHQALIKLPERENPILYPLFRDLAQVLKEVTRPVAEALKQYLQISTVFLARLEPEIGFYLNALKLIRALQAAGLPLCRPDIAPADERVAELDELYNINLALRLHAEKPGQDLKESVIANDVRFGPAGRIFILTGPNRGGKTTYTQSIGLAQVLFQAGLYVPARRARLSPVDAIFTHFPVEEKPQFDLGRLGEEARRLNALFQKATRHSLVLLNESLSTTSPGESLYLARDIVRALRLLGVRAIFATHLHELAQTEQLNASPGDSLAISMVAGAVAQETGTEGSPTSVQRTYKVTPAPPIGLSYAHDIAERYGISFEQLTQTLRERRQITE